MKQNMCNYKCTVCGYIYDPHVGDPEHGIQPVLTFDDLPSDWLCPVCSVGKEYFEKE